MEEYDYTEEQRNDRSVYYQPAEAEDYSTPSWPLFEEKDNMFAMPRTICSGNKVTIKGVLTDIKDGIQLTMLTNKSTPACVFEATPDKLSVNIGNRDISSSTAPEEVFNENEFEVTFAYRVVNGNMNVVNIHMNNTDLFDACELNHMLRDIKSLSVSKHAIVQSLAFDFE